MAGDKLSRRDAIKFTASLGAGAMLPSLAGCAGSGRKRSSSRTGSSGTQGDANRFLADYDRQYQPLFYSASKAQWAAMTDVTDANTEASIAAAKPLNAFVGEKERIESIQRFRGQAWRLDPITNRQISAAFFKAAQYPGTLPDLVLARTEAEAKQTAAQDGFRFTLRTPGQPDKPVTANDIDQILVESNEEGARQAAWIASKEIGVGLRDGLLNLRELRNTCAQELGFSSYFGLTAGEYGMSSAELMALCRTALDQSRPLYEQIHCYAKHRMAERFSRPVPRKIPAHWLPNRWGQQWPGFVEAANLNPYFEKKTPQWIIEQAERFYMSMGFPKLPKSFWERSDLWDLPADSPRKKNAHASAWHLDLEHDVRSLMSVQSNFDWFSTTHHELGHIYYFLAYTNAPQPLLLRDGANRAFHEAIGELISLACAQRPYLAEIGILDAQASMDAAANADQWLLAQAMDGSNIVFQPWSWGVMTGWEHDFYELNLPGNQMNARWWELVGQHQGIQPPAPRGEEFCDPATKTHINDDPGSYYDYAICSMIVYQLHLFIAKNILKQDPHNCNYYGRKDVGEYLQALLSLGASRDWREVLRDFTGEDLSARAMLEYYEPLWPVLRKLNAGRDVSFS